MKVKICGYKNLKNLEMNLTEDKINMIFGMSGSGKSSISGALNSEECERNKTFGIDINQIISVDESTALPLISCYNKNKVDEYVINKNSEDIYKILIDSEKDVKRAEKSLNQIVGKALDVINSSEEKYNKYNQIKKELGSDLNKDYTLRKTAKIVSLENSIKKMSSSKTVKAVQELGPKKLDWFKTGMLYVDPEKKECPFCGKRLSKVKAKKLENITRFESKPIESITNVQNSDANNVLGGIELTLIGIEKTKSTLVKIITALNQYDQVKEMLYEIENFDYDKSSKPIIIGQELKQYFPELYDISKNVLKHLDKVKELMDKAQKNTKLVLSRRLTKINNYLSQMSIPYEIVAEYANNRIKSYKIIHIQDKSYEDRSDAMSDGERCIFALLLFIFKCKNDNSKLIIIDDPASSYDDFRRSQIFKIIQKELSGRTILLLSHDNVYAKYAVADKYKRTDKIYYFENYGEDVNLTEISKLDFGDFNEFVLDRIKNIKDYYQIIINLRMLFEDKHGTNAYGYLSAILHRKSSEEIRKLLDEKNTNEDYVIDSIKKRYPQLRDVNIPKYNENINIDTTDYSILEKAIWARDNAKSALANDNLMGELNEFAHINSVLKICLNPYKFTFCTKRLHVFLNAINIIGTVA